MGNLAEEDETSDHPVSNTRGKEGWIGNKIRPKSIRKRVSNNRVPMPGFGATKHAIKNEADEHIVPYLDSCDR